MSFGSAAGASAVFGFAKKNGVKMADFKFVDVPGTWQHKTVPISQLSASVFTDGTGFDGSSIRGFQDIEASDMLLFPDPATAIMDSFASVPTLSLVCDVVEPGLGKNKYSRDGRHVAEKAEKHLRESGIAGTSFWGPELEFFVFDSVRYHYEQNRAGFSVESSEGIWASEGGGENGDGNLGHKVRNKEGYFPVPPADSMQDLRTEMCLVMQDAGIEVETHHHEVATAGQAEIDMKYDSLRKMADKVMLFKYVVKNVAKRNGKTATFMPKPIFGDNGSGMHVHQSLWKNGKNVFFDEKGYAELSQSALYYAGGLLDHAPALLAFCAPSTNSYKRLVPGYEAPVNLAFSQRNRSAAIRIPMYASGPAAEKSKRLEFRPPDCTANPYFAFSAMLLAGMDGIKKKTDPVKRGFGPLDKNIYKLPESERAKIKNVPMTLSLALDALESDHSFLLEGGVFSKDLIETWIALKRREIDEVRIRTHPHEYYLYYDA